MGGRRIADLDEFMEIQHYRDWSREARAVEHFEHPSGRCYVPVKLPDRARALLFNDLMELSVEDVLRLQEAVGVFLFSLLPSGIILFDECDKATLDWAAGGFPPVQSCGDTVAEGAIRQVKLLAVKLEESADPLNFFECAPMIFDIPLAAISADDLKQAQEATGRLLDRLHDKMELRRQELRLERGPCKMKFRDFLTGDSIATPETKSRVRVKDAEAEALAFLAKHPEWTNKQIAEAVGCNEKSLYRMPTFRKARAIGKSARSNVPRGYKDSEGNIDAQW